MKFSVIIPIHNTEKYLSKCLDSVLNQKFFDFEVICILDKNTDNSLAIAQKYASIDKRLKIIETSFKNAGFARQEGLKIAKGEWIVFVDSDDYLINQNVFEYFNSCLDNISTDIKFKNFETTKGIFPFVPDVLWLHIIRSDIAKNTYFRPLLMAEDIMYLSDLKINKNYRLKVINDNPAFYHYTYPREGSLRYLHE